MHTCYTLDPIKVAIGTPMSIHGDFLNDGCFRKRGKVEFELSQVEFQNCSFAFYLAASGSKIG